MAKLRIAIATKGRDGTKDFVSDVFGRAKAFALIDSEEGKIKNVKILENPAVSYKHGAGPIFVKMLVDSGVNTVLSAELGPGAASLLEQHNVTHIIVKPGTSVKESIRKALGKVEK